MAHAQKPNFVFRRNGRVHLNRRGRQFSRLLAAEVCASAVVKKQSHYRPGQAQRVPGVQVPRFQDSRHMTVVGPTHRPPLPPGNIFGTHFC